jgi:predicted Fe-S protein YdhL (DUF1289 family)
VKLTDDERARWMTAETPAERKAIIREVGRRERAEKAERRLEDAVVDSLKRFIDRNKAVPA